MTQRIIIFIAAVALTQITGCSLNKQDSSSEAEKQLEIVINPTIDLFSLIHRLVGDNQYTEHLLPKYTAEFDNHFNKFNSHPTIEFAKTFCSQHQINGDAPMALAVYIGPPPALEPRIDLSNLPPAFDPRWDSTLICDYLENARKFASESNFRDFQDRQKEFHELSVSNLRKMINRQQFFQWYYDFFGYYPGNFKMYIAMLNGSCSYGYPVTYPDGAVEFVSLIGARFPDNHGIPTYDKDWFLPLIIHEFTHSYVNPLIKTNTDQFEELGEALLETHRAKMIEHGYNVWNVILQEYIVRACTIRFLEQDGSKQKAGKWMEYDINGGFTEIEGLVRLLDKYEDNRKEYRDIESFLPQIEDYFMSYLNEIRDNNAI